MLAFGASNTAKSSLLESPQGRLAAISRSRGKRVIEHSSPSTVLPMYGSQKKAWEGGGPFGHQGSLWGVGLRLRVYTDPYIIPEYDRR